MIEYKIYIGEKLIGTTQFEKADPPMGVVFGEIKPIVKFDYDYIKNLNIDIAEEIPEDKFISTLSSNLIRVLNDKGIEIKGQVNQISGMDKYEYEISIFGIPYPFYEDEFPHHVKEYEKMSENE